MSVAAWRSIAAYTVSLAMGAAVSAAGEEQAPASTVVAYENGYWFTGSTFEPRQMHVRGNIFIEPGERPDLVIDLDGGYVVPPFGEAHNHNVELIPSQPARLEATLNAYLQAGVFYVQNPNTLPGTREDLSERLDRIDSPDVEFAHGGITGRAATRSASSSATSPGGPGRARRARARSCSRSRTRSRSMPPGRRSWRVVRTSSRSDHTGRVGRVRRAGRRQYPANRGRPLESRESLGAVEELCRDRRRERRLRRHLGGGSAVPGDARRVRSRGASP